MDPVLCVRKQRVKHIKIHFSNYPSAAHLAGSGSTVTVILLLQSAPYLYHIDSHEQNGHQPLKNGPKLLYGSELDNSYPVISYDVEDEDKETLEYKKTTGQIINIKCKDEFISSDLERVEDGEEPGKDRCVLVDSKQAKHPRQSQ